VLVIFNQPFHLQVAVLVVVFPLPGRYIIDVITPYFQVAAGVVRPVRAIQYIIARGLKNFLYYGALIVIIYYQAILGYRLQGKAEEKKIYQQVLGHELFYRYNCKNDDSILIKLFEFASKGTG